MVNNELLSIQFQAICSNNVITNNIKYMVIWLKFMKKFTLFNPNYHLPQKIPWSFPLYTETTAWLYLYFPGKF